MSTVKVNSVTVIALPFWQSGSVGSLSVFKCFQKPFIMSRYLFYLFIVPYNQKHFLNKYSPICTVSYSPKPVVKTGLLVVIEQFDVFPEDEILLCPTF